MPRYTVTIRETVEREYEVEAESADAVWGMDPHALTRATLVIDEPDAGDAEIWAVDEIDESEEVLR